MPWGPEQKQQSRERILSSAARLFTQHGFDHVGINEVMTDAGMTRGAFYAHFSSKAELYAESIATAAKMAHLKATEALGSDASLQRVVKGYLSEEHRSGEQINCPLALLITDIGQRDEKVRDAYTRVFKGFVNLIAQGGDMDADEADRQALQQAVLMVGGLAISRAINDEELAATLLDVCRHGVLDGQEV